MIKSQSDSILISYPSRGMFLTDWTYSSFSLLVTSSPWQRTKALGNIVQLLHKGTLEIACTLICINLICESKFFIRKEIDPSIFKVKLSFSKQIKRSIVLEEVFDKKSSNQINQFSPAHSTNNCLTTTNSVVIVNTRNNWR